MANTSRRLQRQDLLRFAMSTCSQIAGTSGTMPPPSNVGDEDEMFASVQFLSNSGKNVLYNSSNFSQAEIRDIRRSPKAEISEPAYNHTPDRSKRFSRHARNVSLQSESRLSGGPSPVQSHTIARQKPPFQWSLGSAQAQRGMPPPPRCYVNGMAQQQMSACRDIPRKFADLRRHSVQNCEHPVASSQQYLQSSLPLSQGRQRPYYNVNTHAGQAPSAPRQFNMNMNVAQYSDTQSHIGSIDEQQHYSNRLPDITYSVPLYTNGQYSTQRQLLSQCDSPAGRLSWRQPPIRRPSPFSGRRGGDGCPSVGYLNPRPPEASRALPYDSPLPAFTWQPKSALGRKIPTAQRPSFQSNRLLEEDKKAKSHVVDRIFDTEKALIDDRKVVNPSQFALAPKNEERLSSALGPLAAIKLRLSPIANLWNRKGSTSANSSSAKESANESTLIATKKDAACEKKPDDEISSGHSCITAHASSLSPYSTDSKRVNVSQSSDSRSTSILQWESAIEGRNNSTAHYTDNLVKVIPGLTDDITTKLMDLSAQTKSPLSKQDNSESLTFKISTMSIIKNEATTEEDFFRSTINNTLEKKIESEDKIEKKVLKDNQPEICGNLTPIQHRVKHFGVGPYEAEQQKLYESTLKNRLKINNDTKNSIQAARRGKECHFNDSVRLENLPLCNEKIINRNAQPRIMVGKKIGTSECCSNQKLFTAEVFSAFNSRQSDRSVRKRSRTASSAEDQSPISSKTPETSENHYHSIDSATSHLEYLTHQRTSKETNAKNEEERKKLLDPFILAVEKETKIKGIHSKDADTDFRNANSASTEQSVIDVTEEKHLSHFSFPSDRTSFGKMHSCQSEFTNHHQNVQWPSTDSNDNPLSEVNDIKLPRILQQCEEKSKNILFGASCEFNDDTEDFSRPSSTEMTCSFNSVSVSTNQLAELPVLLGRDNLCKGISDVRSKKQQLTIEKTVNIGSLLPKKRMHLKSVAHTVTVESAPATLPISETCDSISDSTQTTTTLTDAEVLAIPSTQLSTIKIQEVYFNERRLQCKSLRTTTLSNACILPLLACDSGVQTEDDFADFECRLITQWAKEKERLSITIESSHKKIESLEALIKNSDANLLHVVRRATKAEEKLHEVEQQMTNKLQQRSLQKHPAFHILPKTLTSIISIGVNTAPPYDDLLNGKKNALKCLPKGEDDTYEKVHELTASFEANVVIPCQAAIVSREKSTRKSTTPQLPPRVGHRSLTTDSFFSADMRGPSRQEDFTILRQKSFSSTITHSHIERTLGTLLQDDHHNEETSTHARSTRLSLTSIPLCGHSLRKSTSLHITRADTTDDLKDTNNILTYQNPTEASKARAGETQKRLLQRKSMSSILRKADQPKNVLHIITRTPTHTRAQIQDNFEEKL